MKESCLALVGNPNIGKTTLFNVLTGAHQKVGNWPGVTVEKKSGRLALDGYQAEIVDLPGIYSLDQEYQGLDEHIARQFLETSDVELIINIVDSCNLRRNLQLTYQLLALNKPMIVVLNMSDTAEKLGIDIDADTLAARLGVPVVSTTAPRKIGVDTLKQTIVNQLDALHAETGSLEPADNNAQQPVTAVEDVVERYKIVDRLTEGVVVMDLRESTFTDRIDSFVLNRWLGVPVFLLVMYLLFTVAISFGSVFIDFFDILFAAVLVDGTAWLLTQLNSPDVLVTLLADGLGGGITLVATFIPVIGFLYLGLSVLEDSGYMARAAFVVDRLMSRLGLPGNAFVPLIVGFGCNVPAVMATRTMGRESDRLLTIAMAPFMSCGARLTVYVLFAAAFFPNQGQNIVFALYLLGILVAVITGFIFRKQIFPQEVTPSIQEMPAYHRPMLRNMLIMTWLRLKSFVVKAGKAIVAVVIVLSFLNSIGTDGSYGNQNSNDSVLSAIGKSLTPAFQPIGVSEENWPATVGLFTGMFAKEAIVGTLDALYEQDNEGADQSAAPNIAGALMLALASIRDGLVELKSSLSNPLGIAIGDVSDTQKIADDQSIAESTIGKLGAVFGSDLAAFCYLTFILLYAPCVAVVGAMIRESGWRWAVLVFSWSTLVAYFVAASIYQLGTFSERPYYSAAFLLASFLLMFIVVRSLKTLGVGATQKDRIPAVFIESNS